MLVAEVMNKRVKTIRPEQKVREAAMIMNEFHIGSLLVVSGEGKLVGIITERDILSDVVAQGKSSKEVRVEEVMSSEVITIDPRTTLEDAAALMTKHKIKKLPVLEGGRVVGIITASDLIAYEHRLIEKVASLLLMRRGMGISG